MGRRLGLVGVQVALCTLAVQARGPVYVTAEEIREMVAYARRYHVELGEISSYPPGYKENGGVFSHTNPWIAIADAPEAARTATASSPARISP